MKNINLLKVGNIPLKIDIDKLESQMNELEKFVMDNRYCNTLKHSQDVLFSHEIQANNFIEGYKDDVETIYEVIHKCSKITDPKKKQRILNLYKGYRYILQRNPIDKDNLKKLYSLLSKDLLSQRDLSKMGLYYREEPVFIYYSNRLDVNPDMGINEKEVEEYMNRLFDFINSDNELSKSELFIKSQLLHFYTVYIHPYFDINGRTSRTTSMWYLLNNKAYAFIIFNRAIQLHKTEYYKVIRETKKYKNATYFLNYIMDNTIIELQKDYIMNCIKKTCNQELTSVDFQTLHYILSMQSNITYLDFCKFYNNQNEKKNPTNIFNDMLLPLLEKGIIIEKEATFKHTSCTNDSYNHYFEINKKLYDNNPDKIKYLKIR